MAADAIMAMALFVVVANLRFGTDWPTIVAGYGPAAATAAAAWAIVWTAMLWVLGLYRLRVRWTLRREVFDIVRAAVLLGFLIFGVLFLVHLPQVSRLFLGMLLAAQVAVALVTRALVRHILAVRRARGHGLHYLLVVGAGPAAQAFAGRIRRRRELGLVVIGHLAVEPDELSRPGVLGGIEDLQAVLHSRPVDEVGICLPPAAMYLLEPVARICEEEGRIVRIPLVEGVPELPGGRVEDFDGLPLLSLVYGPDRMVALALKRIADVMIAGAALVVLAPLLLGIAAVVIARDGRPALFVQERVGLHGRTFRMVKFRTMVPDAEARLDELAVQNEIDGPAFKITEDPRLTRTGSFLRRTSLDELPQLLNVLRGDMSLVGPRPPLPAEVAGYDLWHRRRLSMQPGVTGLWQVSARHEADFDRWVELDLAYIDRWSPLLDVRILLATVPAVLRGSGR